MAYVMDLHQFIEDLHAELERGELFRVDAHRAEMHEAVHRHDLAEFVRLVQLVHRKTEQELLWIAQGTASFAAISRRFLMMQQLMP